MICHDSTWQQKKKTKEWLQTHAESLEIEGRSVTNVLTKATALAGNCTLPSFTSETWKRKIWKKLLNAKRDGKLRRNPGRSRNTVPGSIDLYTQRHLLHLKARQRRQNIEDSLYGTNLASLHILTFPVHTGVWAKENSLAKLLDLSSCERDPQDACKVFKQVGSVDTIRPCIHQHSHRRPSRTWSSTHS